MKGTGKDPDRDALSYSWRQTAGTPVNLVGTNTAKPTFDVPGEVRDKLLKFELTVDDRNGGQDTDYVNIIIKNKDLVKTQVESQSNNNKNNHDPSANAGIDRTVYEGTTGVTLKGTGKDPDRDALSYSWRQTAGTPVNLVGTNTAKPTFDVPGEVRDKLLKFELTVDDRNGGQDTDELQIVIEDQPATAKDDRSMAYKSERQATVNQTPFIEQKHYYFLKSQNGIWATQY